MKLQLTKKEVKLIKKALLNQKMGKDEQRTWESISEKMDYADCQYLKKSIINEINN